MYAASHGNRSSGPCPKPARYLHIAVAGDFLYKGGQKNAPRGREKQLMNRRLEIALTRQEQEEMLRTSYTIILSSLDSRGYPHSVPMWYVVRGGRIHMTTYAKSQKALNLRRDPRCSLLLEAGLGYQELRGMLIRGRAELHTEIEVVLDVLLEIQAKHGLGGSSSEVGNAMRAQAAKRVLVVVAPERVSSWDHRKLTGGGY